MEGSGDDRSEGERDARRERGDWFAQQLGGGWAEVQPGIYRFVAAVRNEPPIPMRSPSERTSDSDMLEALSPAEGDPEPPQPARRLFRRRARTVE